jgi:hypothetical protein
MRHERNGTGIDLAANQIYKIKRNRRAWEGMCKQGLNII